MTPRDLDVEGLANARDLGGLERNDGSVTPTGVFYRSEMLDRVTSDGWRVLRDLGVRTVVDLRRPEERTAADGNGIDLIAADLDGDDEQFWAPYEADGRWGTPLYYLPHLAGIPGRMRAVLDAIAAAPDGAVLFHCAAGWDRTGLVSAMLLRALDVTPDAAVTDYLRSFETAPAMEALHGRSSHVQQRLGVLSSHGHTPESAFRTAYTGLDVDAWFATAEVAPTTRVAVRTWRGAVSS